MFVLLSLLAQSTPPPPEVLFQGGSIPGYVCGLGLIALIAVIIGAMRAFN